MRYGAGMAVVRRKGTEKRRTGTENSKTRALLLEVTKRVMLDDGYAAVSSRRIAQDAGFTPALVHYYFPTLDDLFVAVFRQVAERQLERQQQSLQSPQPLHALWSFQVEKVGTALLMEFMALANHRKAIAGEIAYYTERFRQVQLEGLSGRLDEYDLDTADVPRVAVLVLLTSLSRTVVQERSIGVHTGLPETIELVERYLERLEGRPPKSGTRKGTRVPRRRRRSRPK
jgi:AcrR family transcriptional regulator